MVSLLFVPVNIRFCMLLKTSLYVKQDTDYEAFLNMNKVLITKQAQKKCLQQETLSIRL